MRAVKFSLLVILILSCLSFFGCPYEEGQVIDDPSFPSLVKVTSPAISGNGKIITARYEINGNPSWSGPAMSSDQGSIFPSGPATKLDWDIYSIQATKPIDTGMLIDFNIPIITIGGWDPATKLVLPGKDLPPGWKIVVRPWRVEPLLKTLHLVGPSSTPLSGELARIYVTSGTEVKIDRYDSNETYWLLREKLQNISLKKEAAYIYEQTSSVSLNVPVNQVKVDFMLPGSNDKLLEARIAEGPLFYWGELSYSSEPPIASSGAIMVKNWGVELIPRLENPVAAPSANALFVLKQTRQKDGSVLVEIKKLNSTSQVSVERQEVRDGFIFADIRYLGGPLKSVKLPTKVVIPANNPPVNGKQPTTWGKIRTE